MEHCFSAARRSRETMTDHKIGTREEWLAARLELLKAEKELTRRNDELAQWRQKLPWVRIDKEYRFETDEGTVSLADLFRGRSQLLVYHFMFGPEYTGGCPACSAVADGFNGFAVHLAHPDVAFVVISRAPITALQAYKRRMGWTFKWASSLDSDVNYNYRKGWTDLADGTGAGSAASPGEFAAMTGTDVPTYAREAPAMSAFALEDGVVYHTYSTYARGLDSLWGMYQWLDRTPKGRNETG